jgi:tetratricopeptide (TPR) repeat protein
LEAAQRADDKEKEAECYQKIGHIQERLGDLEKAIEFLNKFLVLCEETDTGEQIFKNKKKKAGEAHKQLAEAHSKNGNVHAAIKHLEDLLNIANDEKDKPAQADAFLKLGLLYYQEGIVRKSVDCLWKHFELARADSEETKK